MFDLWCALLLWNNKMVQKYDSFIESKKWFFYLYLKLDGVHTSCFDPTSSPYLWEIVRFGIDPSRYLKDVGVVYKLPFASIIKRCETVFGVSRTEVPQSKLRGQRVLTHESFPQTASMFWSDFKSTSPRDYPSQCFERCVLYINYH
jgi:hypothetical protein